METLHNGFTIDFPGGAFPLSTDSMVLADFVRLPKNARVLDLGSGCGTLGLMLCARDPGCRVWGVELSEAAHAAALGNIARNDLTDRLFSICADLRSIPDVLPKEPFHCVISNPPYFSGGKPSTKTPVARQDDFCAPAELFTCAAKHLRYGGDFFLVHKLHRLSELMVCACSVGLEPKVLRLVRHKPDAEPGMILLQCRKGGKPGLRLEEVTLFSDQGSPTEDYRRIYHL